MHKKDRLTNYNIRSEQSRLMSVRDSESTILILKIPRSLAMTLNLKPNRYFRNEDFKGGGSFCVRL